MLLAAAVVVAAVLLWRWRKQRRCKVVLPPPIPAHVRAKQKLEEALALIAQPKPFVMAVSDTARTYLEERFEFRAPERTTEEFLRELAGTKLLLPDQKESLGNFLASCDLVKFAKYEPGETELRGLHGSAVRLVEETEPTAEMKVASGRPANAASRRKPNRQQVVNQIMDLAHPLFSAAPAAAPAGVAEGPAGRAPGICVFLGATRARHAKHHPFARRRLAHVPALAGVGGVHRGPGATAPDQEHHRGQGQRHRHRGRAGPCPAACACPTT